MSSRQLRGTDSRAPDQSWSDCTRCSSPRDICLFGTIPSESSRFGFTWDHSWIPLHPLQAVPQHHFGREFEWCGFPYCSMREDHAEQPNLKIFSSRWSRCLPTACACRFSGTPSPFLASITHADTRTPLKFSVDYYCFWRQAFLSNENMNRTMRLCFDLTASETEKRTSEMKRSVECSFCGEMRWEIWKLGFLCFCVISYKIRYHTIPSFVAP